MEIEDALSGWIVDQDAYADLIREPSRVRFFKLKVPQGSRFPCTVVQRSGTDRQYRACRIDGTVGVTLQIDHYGKTWQAMANLAAKFRQVLDPQTVDYPALMGPDNSPFVGLKVRGAFLENEFDGEDVDPGLLRRTQLWTFWVSEP